MDIILSVESISSKLNGIPRYNWELARGLANHGGLESLRFFCRGEWITGLDDLLQDRSSPRKKLRLPRRWREKLQKRSLAKGLYHGPNFFVPESVDQAVVTVHDLSVYLHPETHPAARVADFHKGFEKSLERVGHIITDTETVRQEMVSYFGVSPERVTAVPLGVDASYRPHAAADMLQTLQRYGLTPGHYGLFVSTIEPRKGIVQLLRAWDRLPVKLRSAYPLVLIGGKGWLNEEIHILIDKYQRDGWLRYLGYVDEQDLTVIYAGAAMFAYPSIYEGFGLPPVEAMASGVPVVASNRSCIPEVLGDAAALVDPHDQDAMVEALEQALTDTCWREKAIAKGLKRAAGYNWQSCVDKTVEVYKKIWDAR